MGRSLAEVYPKIALEWSERNLPVTADQVTYGSNKVYWWYGKCGHEWETSVKARTSGEKCPYCAGKRVLVGFNDLSTVSPALASEWSEKNGKLRPQDVTAGSRKKGWRKCRTYGHEWKSVVYTRTSGGRCPVCEGREIKPG